MSAKLISVDTCHTIMNGHGIAYSEEELQTLREFLYRLYDISSSHYSREKEKEALVIHLNESDHETKSLPLYPGEHRRAS